MLNHYSPVELKFCSSNFWPSDKSKRFATERLHGILDEAT